MSAILALAASAALSAAPSIDVSAVEAQIAARCGVRPKVSVDWGTFGDDKGAMTAIGRSKLAFVGAAFGQVCKDPALKVEVGKQIAKVSLRQAYGATEPVLYINAKTLVIEYLWVLNDPVPDAKRVGDELADRLRGGEPEEP